MATLVDLAERGYIGIYNRGDDFVIYKKPTDRLKQARLKAFERILIEEMFLPKQKRIGSFDIEARAARHLFSRKIALVYLSIYDEAQSRGYFSQSPAKIHLKYRLAGIIFFFLGLVGYGIFALFSPDPKFVLFFWLSLIVFGILIVNFAPRLTSYTPRGKVIRERWLRFKNFLAQERLIKESDELFEEYLPFAIALGVEAAWAARFIETNFRKPNWYDFSAPLSGVENFTKSFLPVIDYIAETLNLSSEPLVK